MQTPGPEGRPPPRRRQTSRSVRLIDRLANAVITVGGLFVILAVFGILAYLVGVVVPLFRGATASAPFALALPPAPAPPLFAEVDEYRSLVLAVHADAALSLLETRHGKPVSLEHARLDLPAPIRSFSRPLQGGGVCFGLEDGSVVSGQLGFEPDFPPESDLGLTAPLEPGQRAAVAGGAVERTPEGLIRRVRPKISLAPPVSISAGDPVVLLDCRVAEQRESFAALTARGRLLVSSVTSKKNFATGEVQRRARSREVPWPHQATPSFILLTSRGDQLYLAWADGMLSRYDVQGAEAPVLAERVDLLPEPGVELRSLGFPIGEQSILAADSRGRVLVLMRISAADHPASTFGPAGSDGFVMVTAHQLEPHAAPVAAVAFSLRDKSVATMAEDGAVWLRHTTSEQTLLKLQIPVGGRPRLLQIAPKGDGILAFGADGQGKLWPIHNPHPETTLASLTGKIWYEGYPRPGHTWQSSSGTDDFEPKFGLAPLVFGTFKATLFAMLLAVPLGLGAAIFTSEFLRRDLRGVIKPLIETMASLPSVVLGFIAALVLAPFVESWALPVLLGFLLAPLLFVSAGLLMQLLPHPWPRRLGGRIQLLLLLALPLLGWWLAAVLAPGLERLAFGGDFKAWLAGRAGSGAPLSAALAWPVCILGLAWLHARFLRAWLIGRESSHRRAAVLDSAAAFAVLAASLALAASFGMAAASAGVDLRPWMLGTYVQRNTLIVSFAMGFAVIPLIYTISEDALSSVPEDLRSASLGCGATRWQTAIRVVLPMAASGVFAAAMIGLGRAVGETMIVLMAAGNTPLIDINPFNGLRALSANIAVELPEAVQNSTLYRVLFLAALVLFVMTFVVNTAAEVIRLRFRKRVARL